MSPSTRFTKKLSLFTVLFIAWTFSSVSALTISPARIELTADPGSSVSDTFLLINEQESEQTFYTSVENFEAQGESGTPSFTAAQEGFASWVSVEEKVTLKKGERVKVQFSVAVPKDADAGGHFAAIFVSTVPPSSKAGGVAVGAKVGMLMLLRVNGEVKEGGGVLSFSLKDKSRFVSELPVQFMYRFNNSGNDRVNPTGEIAIRNMLGITVERLNANPSVGNVLPNSTRRFDVTWGNEEPLTDSASFFAHAGYQARNFAFGFYNAKMTLTFGSASKSVNTTMLFVFPWQLMVLVTLFLIALFAALRILIKRYNTWIIKQARLQGQ